MQTTDIPKLIDTADQPREGLPAKNGSPPLDAATLLRLKPIMDEGETAIQHRTQFHDLIVNIARALGVPCSNFASDIVHAQYMELGVRILARIKENVKNQTPPPMA